MNQLQNGQYYVSQASSNYVFFPTTGQIFCTKEWGEKIPNFDESNPQADDPDKFTGVDVQLSKEKEDEECPVCLDPYKEKGPVKGTGVCDHVFHSDCLRDCLKHDHKCPVCRQIVIKKLGPSPDGYMFVAKDPNKRCQGYDDCGVIIIRYQINGGIQGRKHPNPGTGYQGEYREAYLPDNEEGGKVLKLLRRAWEMKMTFTVGRSLTRGMSDVVTWNDIHHKTSLSGGAYGYPDPSYLQRVTEDMKALGIKLDG